MEPENKCPLKTSNTANIESSHRNWQWKLIEEIYQKITRGSNFSTIEKPPRPENSIRMTRCSTLPLPQHLPSLPIRDLQQVHCQRCHNKWCCPSIDSLKVTIDVEHKVQQWQICCPGDPPGEVDVSELIFGHLTHQQ